MPYRRTEMWFASSAPAGGDLAAAEALASESGMGAVQIAPVAQRAGIAAGTVYRYFPSKTALVAALVEAQLAAEMRRLRVRLALRPARCRRSVPRSRPLRVARCAATACLRADRGAGRA